MKTIVRNRFGPPEVLELQEAAKPDVAHDGVLVRVRACSLNPADWYAVAGKPWIARPMTGLRGPKDSAVTTDFAGTVEAVGADVTEFRAGDEAFGRSDSFVEYLSFSESEPVVVKAATATFEEAAALPVAASTALQALRDHAQVRPGQKVLINGASGGVGTFAVQIAKAFGAEVTAVCSTRNVEQARALGADHVVDYTRDDFTRSDRRYDVMLDIAGSRSWRACKRVLTRDATVVLVGGPRKSRLLGPLGHLAAVRLAALRSSRKVVFFVAKLNKGDLTALRELLEAGKVTPVIDKRYELREVADAFRYLGEGHARGKVVVSV